MDIWTIIRATKPDGQVHTSTVSFSFTIHIPVLFSLSSKQVCSLLITMPLGYEFFSLALALFFSLILFDSLKWILTLMPMSMAVAIANGQWWWDGMEWDSLYHIILCHYYLPLYSLPFFKKRKKKLIPLCNQSIKKNIFFFLTAVTAFFFLSFVVVVEIRIS